MRALSFHTALVVGLLLFPLAASAAVTLPLPWKLGDKHRYQSVSVLEKTRAGKTQRTETREIDQVEIAEANAKGFLQTWWATSSSASLSGDGDNLAAERELMQQLATRLRDLPMEAELAGNGSYLRLRNWKQLGAAMREVMLPAMVKQASLRPDLAKADLNALRIRLAPMLDKMTSEQAIGTTLGKNIAIFNFFTAASIPPDAPVTYEDYLPSPWSADLIPTKGSFRLAGRDDKAGTITIEWKQDIDPAKVAKGMRLSDYATVLVDRRTGVPLRLDHRRRVEAGTSKTTSTWRLVKLPN